MKEVEKRLDKMHENFKQFLLALRGIENKYRRKRNERD
jgi:hypothetical protein